MTTNIKGNLTTIVKFAVMIIAPYFGVAEATSNQLVALIVAAIGLILAYFDAKYDNTLISQPNIEEVAKDGTIGWYTEPVNDECDIPEEIEQAIHDVCEEESINPEYTNGDEDGA